VIEGFDILEDGKLIVDTMIKDDNGKDQRGMGEIDVTRTDIEFSIWAMDSVWPFIKHYAFATTVQYKTIIKTHFNPTSTVSEEIESTLKKFIVHISFPSHIGDVY
jgi:hypothetical protein